MKLSFRHTPTRSGALLRARTWLLLAAALAAGCATDQEIARRVFEMRVAKYPAIPADERPRLQRGDIAPGDTPEMVWVARGEPSRRSSRVAAGQTNEVWSYCEAVRMADPTARGAGAGSWRPMVVAGGRTVWVRDTARVSNEVVREVELLRVAFASNRVVSVEAPNPAAKPQP